MSKHEKIQGQNQPKKNKKTKKNKTADLVNETPLHNQALVFSNYVFFGFLGFSQWFLHVFRRVFGLLWVFGLVLPFVFLHQKYALEFSLEP